VNRCSVGIAVLSLWTPTETLYRTEAIKVLRVPDTLFGLLDAIRERLGMYVGRKSLWDFSAWIDGDRLARMQTLKACGSQADRPRTVENEIADMRGMLK